MALEALVDLFGHGRVTSRFVPQSLDKYTSVIGSMKYPVVVEVHYQPNRASEVWISAKKRVENSKAVLDFISKHIWEASRGKFDSNFHMYSGRMQENAYGEYLTIIYQGKLSDPAIYINIGDQAGILGRIITKLKQLKK